METENRCIDKQLSRQYCVHEHPELVELAQKGKLCPAQVLLQKMLCVAKTADYKLLQWRVGPTHRFHPTNLYSSHRRRCKLG